MIAIQFKKTSGSSARDFNAVIVEPDFVLDGEQYSDINKTLRNRIDAKYLAWNIRFSFLPEDDQDYLLELRAEAAPQFIHESTTYNIRIEPGSAIRPYGATMTVVKTTPE